MVEADGAEFEAKGLRMEAERLREELRSYRERAEVAESATAEALHRLATAGIPPPPQLPLREQLVLSLPLLAKWTGTRRRDFRWGPCRVCPSSSLPSPSSSPSFPSSPPGRPPQSWICSTPPEPSPQPPAVAHASYYAGLRHLSTCACRFFSVVIAFVRLILAYVHWTTFYTFELTIFQFVERKNPTGSLRCFFWVDKGVPVDNLR